MNGKLQKENTMSKTYGRNIKYQMVEEELELEIDTSQDVNAKCFSNTYPKTGQQNNMNWSEMYQFFQRKEYLV